MTEPTYTWNFTQTCATCGQPVQYSNGQREPHPCPENLPLVIEGCNAATPLVERVEQALTDHEKLAVATAPGEFCHRHFSWLCQAGQGRCQREGEGMAQHTRPTTRRSYDAIQADIEAAVDAWVQAQPDACERLRDLWNEIVFQATEDKELPKWARFAAITTRNGYARRARDAQREAERQP